MECSLMSELADFCRATSDFVYAYGQGLTYSPGTSDRMKRRRPLRSQPNKNVAMRSTY